MWKQREEPVGHIHGHHHQVAMGQVDDPHDAHDEGHAEANQGIQTAQQEPRNQRLQKEFKLCCQSSSPESYFLSLHLGMG